MSDFTNLLDEDFDRYVIGFTENHFIPSDTNSPTPSDHGIGYNTFAADYAERSNRGELKIFLDHSFNLDRQKKQSVSKINTNILDLMFELSERRKVTTPILSKSAMDFHRSDSRFSDVSDASFKTSSSLPLIEVQQLPPLIQPNRSMPALSHDFFGLPDLDTNVNMKKTKKKRKNGKLNKVKNTVKRQDSTDPKTVEYVRQTSKKRSEEKAKADVKTDENNNTEIDSKNVRFTIGDSEIETDEEKNDNDISVARKSGNKWSEIDEKLKEAAAMLKKKADSDIEYRGRYFSVTGESSARKMSFCQSSYKERAERERMNNIRRRHSSQTNVGPLDFNKLRRQLTIGRSRTTMYC